MDVQIPRELIQLATSNKDLTKWENESKCCKLNLDELNPVTQKEKYDYQLSKYKRSLDLQHKYRQNTMKKSIEVLNSTDLKHMKYVLKLKKVIATLKQLEAFKTELDNMPSKGEN